ncbi:hypothetical protein LTR36_010339 [Oleoguttula mirabilis]|uniref:Heterokaryon incompatibility domain-containing protein n=1 Tax=Oleoguttula mirabilis TaxID=1507867 RepID=A0AAV9J4E5_9PEZI|nr:hypothetical protein LTR36_010339 [Oleoguttula mirabilis]
MRLLHTAKLVFEEFFENEVPPYAILSHRWDAKELSFQEFEDSRASPKFEKVKSFCAFALRNDHSYVWVDTCCIDKKSSAELSEALNSMFTWYRKAEICYAHLSDVVWTVTETVAAASDLNFELWEQCEQSDPFLRLSLEQFRESAWFTRGWTLQELLAPVKVLFLDCNWEPIFTRQELHSVISGITGINPLYLQRPRLVTQASVAEKMSWISRRETSRVEDMAYCLLGLFNVNMPLLYGEGKKAFLRLQIQIISQSDDESIFAWAGKQSGGAGMLASWPSAFSESGGISPCHRWHRPPYTMTNKGLQLYVPARAEDIADGSKKSIKFALNCKRGNDELEAPVIELERYKASVRWRRINCRELQWEEAPPGTQICGKAPSSMQCEPLFVHQAR